MRISIYVTRTVHTLLYSQDKKNTAFEDLLTSGPRQMYIKCQIFMRGQPLLWPPAIACAPRLF